MSQSLVMTLLGSDRPGLVEAISSAILEQGGNWLESRMAHLGGQFAGIVRVDVPRARQEALVAALEKLGSRGLKVMVHADAAAPEQKRPAQRVKLDFVGHDRPGIVSQIAQALARRNINVEEFESGCESAPMTGESLFRAAAILGIPPDCDLAAARTDLEKIAADLIIEVSLQPVPDQKTL